MLPSVVAAQRASAGASACGPCEGLDADLAAGTSGPRAAGAGDAVVSCLWALLFWACLAYRRSVSMYPFAKLKRRNESSGEGDEE